MSYAKFLDDWNDEIGRLLDSDGRSEGREIPRDRHLELQDLAHKKVFDQWIAEERFGELISYLHSNFDSGQGDEWLYPLSEALTEKHLVRELKRLWRGVIAMRSKRFWNALSAKKNVAERKAYTLDALRALESALKILGHETEALKILDEINLIESEKRSPKRKTMDKRRIDEDLFWELIGESRNESNSNPEFIECLKEKLVQFSSTQIRQFQKILLENLEQLKSWDLWGLAYIARRGCSDDAFDYFRAWTISQGKVAFELAKGDMLGFLQHISFEEDPQLESFLYLAEEAYEQRSDSPMKPITIKYLKLSGEQWQEADLCNRFPELCSRFGYD